MWMKELKGVFKKRSYKPYSRLVSHSDSELDCISRKIGDQNFDFGENIMGGNLENENLLVLTSDFEKLSKSQTFDEDFKSKFLINS